MHGRSSAGAGGNGWYPESWPHCDLAELPAEAADAAGLEIWTDGHGRADHVAEPFLARTRLPADAVEAEYRRGRDRLWLTPDRARAFVGPSPDSVERWPRVVEPFGCL